MDSPIEHVALVVIAGTAIATTALGAPWWVPVVLTIAMAVVLLPRIFSRTRQRQPLSQPLSGDDRAPDTGPIGGGSDRMSGTRGDPPFGGGSEARLRALSDISALAVDTLDESSVDQACVMAIRDVLGIAVCEIRRGPADGSSRGEAKIFPRRSADSSSPTVEDHLVEIPIGGSPDAAIVLRPDSPEQLDAGDIGFLETMASVLGLAQQRAHAARDADRSNRIDEVTGLVNRSLFLGRLRSAITRSKRQRSDLAVMLFGLDNFRFVNESLGHSAGDALLETCARRLSDAMRPGDLVARLGGDEFVVLTTGLVSAETAAITAERLRSSLEGSATIEGRSVKVAASAGLAVAGEDTTAEEILQRADLALHSAKASGGGRAAAFAPEMLDAAVSRLRTDGELREALAEGQLRVFYQPIVDLATGRTVAAEALVRWFRPGGGMVSPKEFIPISEQTGLVNEIGRWVMEESILQAAKWSLSGRPMRVSVNVSPRQLIDDDLLATIDHALEHHGLGPELLVLELTERAMVAELSDMVDTLTELAERGITIAIDDFGTGHSSITHLKSLPVDVVKIDRSFTAGIDRSGADFAMTAAMVQMCKALGKTVIAEGVETSSQLELLQDLDCDQAQGYLFSPAIHDLEPPPSEDSWIRLALDRT